MAGKLTSEEVYRKLLHGLSGTAIPLGILYLPRVPQLGPRGPSTLLGVALVLFLAVEIVRLRWPPMHRLFEGSVGSMMRPEESRKFTGATYIVASAFLCTVVFRSRPDISFMALSMFILGDAVAAIVGLGIGRIRVAGKTLEGSAACFLLCLVLLVGVYPVVPGLLDPWGGRLALPVVLAAALSTTILELFPIRLGRGLVINDNLTVPLATGVLMLALYPGFAAP